MKKHFRLDIHFELDIDDSSLSTFEDPSMQEYMERQKRLFDAILAHPEAFEHLQVYFLTAHFECMSWKDWYNLHLGSSEIDIEDVLRPVIDKLNSDDKEWFEDGIAQGVFFESVETTHDCFTTTIKNINITEVEGGDES